MASDPSAATPLEQDVNRAFRLWCAEADFAIDYTAPHWEAFQAGYEHGREDEYHAYLRSAVTWTGEARSAATTDADVQPP
jgi:hypothetical protein